MSENDPPVPRRGRPRPLRGLLRGQRSTLSAIAERARLLSRLQRRLQAALPAALQGHWQLASVDAEALGIVASGPSWATALRYRQSLLLDAAERAIGTRPARCRISVDPPRLARRRAPPTLSRQSAAHIGEAARSVDDPALAAALARLSRRADDD